MRPVFLIFSSLTGLASVPFMREFPRSWLRRAGLGPALFSLSALIPSEFARYLFLFGISGGIAVFLPRDQLLFPLLIIPFLLGLSLVVKATPGEWQTFALFLVFSGVLILLCFLRSKDGESRKGEDDLPGRRGGQETPGDTVSSRALEIIERGQERLGGLVEEAVERGRVSLYLNLFGVFFPLRREEKSFIGCLSREGEDGVAWETHSFDLLSPLVKSPLILGKPCYMTGDEARENALLGDNPDTGLVFSFPVIIDGNTGGFVYGEREGDEGLTPSEREVVSLVAALTGRLSTVSREVEGVKGIALRYDLLTWFIRSLPEMRDTDSIIRLTSEMVARSLGDSLVYCLLRGEKEGNFLILTGDEEEEREEVECGGSILMWALSRGTPRIIKRYDGDAHAIYRIPERLHSVVRDRSLIVYPFAFQGEEGEVLEGVFLVVAREGEGFSGWDVRQVDFIVDLTKLALPGVLRVDRLQMETRVDPLTGLANRRELFRSLDRELGRSQRSGRPLSLALLDIDHFKRINDTYGHPFGDEVIKGIARIMKALVRPYDIVSRYGGEEFAIVLPETDLKRAEVVAERVRTSVRNRLFECRGERVPVTVSIGIATYPEDGENAQELIDMADRALYHSKKSGRDRISTVSDLLKQSG